METPTASDTNEALADWLELQALQSDAGEASLESLVRVIRRAGSTDAFAGGDKGSVESQRVGQDAFSELDNRLLACGAAGYPFDIEQGLIRLKKGGDSSAYVLMLLMSINKPTAGHEGTAAIFEHLCRHAAHRYLGGDDNQARAIRIGAPRKAPHAKLCQAIDALCLQVAEGGGCRFPHKAQHLGDDGLDIVAWRDFPDLKAGKLIAFGQCASGAGDWEEKLAELQSAAYVRKWFRSHLVIDPIRLFFLPRRVAQDDWEHASIDGGVLFDRCRIVACLPANLDADVAALCKKIRADLLGKLRKPKKVSKTKKLWKSRKAKKK